MSASSRCRRHLERGRIAVGVEMVCAGAHRTEPLTAVSAHSGDTVVLPTALAEIEPTQTHGRSQTIRPAVRPQSP